MKCQFVIYCIEGPFSTDGEKYAPYEMDEDS